jgi:8-oxo-dGTP diphosphatase
MATWQKVGDIDWSAWQPADRATLIFVVRDGQVLLIHKKRGLGAGKINAPGGRLDPGETPLQCAVRELREELLVEAQDPRWSGELHFQFADGYSIHAHVFRTGAITGTPTETDEAMPLWVPAGDLPFERMWPDDRLWVPLLLEDRPFRGWFLFDGDRMMDHAVEPAGADVVARHRGGAEDVNGPG